MKKILTFGLLFGLGCLCSCTNSTNKELEDKIKDKTPEEIYEMINFDAFSKSVEDVFIYGVKLESDIDITGKVNEKYGTEKIVGNYKTNAKSSAIYNDKGYYISQDANIYYNAHLENDSNRQKTLVDAATSVLNLLEFDDEYIYYMEATSFNGDNKVKKRLLNKKDDSGFIIDELFSRFYGIDFDDIISKDVLTNANIKINNDKYVFSITHTRDIKTILSKSYSGLEGIKGSIDVAFDKDFLFSGIYADVTATSAVVTIPADGSKDKSITSFSYKLNSDCSIGRFSYSEITDKENYQ